MGWGGGASAVWHRIFAGADVEEPDSGRSNGGGEFLMCIGEAPVKSTQKNETKVTVGFLVTSLQHRTLACSFTATYVHPQAVQPSIGNMVYDEFHDSSDIFAELETRLSHLEPVEILFQSGCSKRLEQTLHDWKTYCGK